MPFISQKTQDIYLKRFSSLELLTFLYAFLTTVYIIFFYRRIEQPFTLLLYRIIVCTAIIIFSQWYRYKPMRILEFIRVLFPLMMIMYWYPETYYLTHGISGGAVLVPNLDPFFDKLDIMLFGCSPAMEFSALIPQAWFSEIMYFAYFFYYAMYAYIGFYFFFRRHENIYQVTFTVLMCFFIYYITFIFIPVEGPQFYYAAADAIVPDGYFFSDLMRTLQGMGEKPTGAFPSSHVGMTLIYLIVFFKYDRKAFWITFPVACLLFASTVYIKAHYLIDVIVAFVYAPVIYWLSLKTYNMYKKRFEGLDNIEYANSVLKRT